MELPKITAFPTYWENGMKLSANHFQHLENSIEDALRDARALSNIPTGSFGLLPYSYNPSNIENGTGVNAPNRLTLNTCRAILPGGHRVEILPQNIQNLRIPTVAPFVEFRPNRDVRYHVFLVVQPKRVSAGVPETSPIRNPYLCYDYKLECIPQDRMKAVSGIAANRMKIAEWKNGKLIEGYIPPTLIIRGFSLLERWHKHFQNQLENIVKASIAVANQYRKSDKARVEFCVAIVHYIRSSHAHFRWVIPEQAPVMMVAYIGDLAGLVQGLLETCDRDFVRTQLKNGELNQIRNHVQAVLRPTPVPQREMALIISRSDKFIRTLFQTIQLLLERNPAEFDDGDR